MSAPRLAHIVRHPIKSVGFQEIECATLTKGRTLPFDRQWAVATEGPLFDGDPEAWVRKLAFVRGAAEGALQAIRCDFDADSGAIGLTHPALGDFAGHLPDDGAALVDWLRPLWPTTRPAPVALVSRRDGGALTDVPGAWLSVLNLASNRALGDSMGQELSIHRWRGNLWLDGLPAWQEFDLIGQDIAIGGARLHIEQRITRCNATTFDPITGARDGDTLSALQGGWGHRDFGVYASVVSSGAIRIGDTASVLT